MQKINKTEELIAKLKSEGKHRLLDTPEDIAAIERMNEMMEEVHRDYLMKSAGSSVSAANCWVW